MIEAINTLTDRIVQNVTWHAHQDAKKCRTCCDAVIARLDHLLASSPYSRRVLVTVDDVDRFHDYLSHLGASFENGNARAYDFWLSCIMKWRVL